MAHTSYCDKKFTEINFANRTKSLQKVVGGPLNTECAKIFTETIFTITHISDIGNIFLLVKISTYMICVVH